jgi:hypothetical protein
VDSALIGSYLCGSGNLRLKEASCLNAEGQRVMFIDLLLLSIYANFYVLFPCFFWEILARCHFTYNGTSLAVKDFIFRNNLLQTVSN